MSIGKIGVFTDIHGDFTNPSFRRLLLFPATTPQSRRRSSPATASSSLTLDVDSLNGARAGLSSQPLRDWVGSMGSAQPRQLLFTGGS